MATLVSLYGVALPPRFDMGGKLYECSCTVYLPKRILGTLAARLEHSNDGLPECWGPSELKTVEKTKIH
jgi:hypothetical protein